MYCGGGGGSGGAVAAAVLCCAGRGERSLKGVARSTDDDGATNDDREGREGFTRLAGSQSLLAHAQIGKGPKRTYEGGTRLEGDTAATNENWPCLQPLARPRPVR